MTIFSLPCERDSENLGAALAHCLQAPLVLSFIGDIGAGKTTLIRAVLKNIGIKETIKSPTFSLVESYSHQNILLHHFDLYRIQAAEELDYIGFRDYFCDNSIGFIEWPQNAEAALPPIDISLKLDIKERGRQIQALSLSDRGEKLLACIKGKR